MILGEQYKVEKGFLGDADGGVSTERLHVTKANKVAVALKVEAGVATTFSFKIQEHNAAALGTTNDVVTTVPVYYKADADAAYTRLDPSVALVEIADLNTAAGLVVVEIELQDLTDGFEYVSLAITAPGAARNVAAMYLVDTKLKPAYQVEL